MSSIAGLVDIIGHALHAVLEAPETFTKALAEFRQLFAAKENQDNDSKNDEVCWCEKLAHSISPCSRNIHSPTGTHYCRTCTIQ